MFHHLDRRAVWEFLGAHALGDDIIDDDIEAGLAGALFSRKRLPRARSDWSGATAFSTYFFACDTLCVFTATNFGGSHTGHVTGGRLTFASGPLLMTTRSVELPLLYGYDTVNILANRAIAFELRHDSHRNGIRGYSTMDKTPFTNVPWEIALLEDPTAREAATLAYFTERSVP